MQLTPLIALPYRFIALRRGVELGVLVVIIICVAYAQNVALLHRRAYEVALRAQSQQPEAQALLADLQQQLAGAKSRLDTMSALVLPRENIGEYLSFLEQRAAKYQVQVRITGVKEEVPAPPVEGASPPPVAISTGYTIVRVNVVGNGETSSLFEYLHDIEHGPYIVTVPNWLVRASMGASSGFVVSPRGATAPPGKSTEDTRPHNQVTADILLLMR